MEKQDKIDRILDFIEQSKEDKGFNRVLGWMEKHPILSVIVLYVFISKITKGMSQRHNYD